MGYLFLAIALLAGSLKGFCGKKISGKVLSLKGVFYINFVRMVLCIVIGLLIVLSNGFFKLKVSPHTLLITATSGIFTSLFVATWIMCVRKGAYVMVDVFLMLGAMVTVALCNLFFNEPITLYHIIGFLLLLFSSLIMCSYSRGVKGSFTPTSLMLLLICGFCNGMADFSQKWFVKTALDGSIAVFNFYTYLFSALTLLIFFLIAMRAEKGENDGKNPKILLVVALMSLCLFAYSYFKTSAARYIDSAILYPLSNGAAIVLSAIMASVFFGEKITKKCIFGILIALLSMVVINL